MNCDFELREEQWTCTSCGRTTPKRKDNPPAANCRSVPIPRRTVAPLTCVHRGAVTREESCESCKGKVRIKVFACELHTECHLSRKELAVRSCLTCGDRRPDQ